MFGFKSKIVLAGALVLGTAGLSANAAPVAKAPEMGQLIQAQASTTRVPRSQPKKMKSQKAKKAPASTMPRPSNQ